MMLWMHFDMRLTAGIWGTPRKWVTITMWHTYAMFLTLALSFFFLSVFMMSLTYIGIASYHYIASMFPIRPSCSNINTHAWYHTSSQSYSALTERQRCLVHALDARCWQFLDEHCVPLHSHNECECVRVRPFQLGKMFRVHFSSCCRGEG